MAEIRAVNFIKLTSVEWLEAMVTNKAILMVLVSAGADMRAEYIFLTNSAISKHCVYKMTFASLLVNMYTCPMFG